MTIHLLMADIMKILSDRPAVLSYRGYGVEAYIFMVKNCSLNLIIRFHHLICMHTPTQNDIYFTIYYIDIAYDYIFATLRLSEHNNTTVTHLPHDGEVCWEKSSICVFHAHAGLQPCNTRGGHLNKSAPLNDFTTMAITSLSTTRTFAIIYRSLTQKH